MDDLVNWKTLRILDFFGCERGGWVSLSPFFDTLEELDIRSSDVEFDPQEFKKCKKLRVLKTDYGTTTTTLGEPSAIQGLRGCKNIEVVEVCTDSLGDLLEVVKGCELVRSTLKEIWVDETMVYRRGSTGITQVMISVLRIPSVPLGFTWGGIIGLVVQIVDALEKKR